ncbi:hypothetical protein OG730_34750 [Streptomyces sp. NBC_01298]|uniref:hypothetical protein n=1 Tax=Streptomyces sp. NBC_01298 TaxID=2903817 RepID=UPI002E11AF7A|nr:hypothetical protein OG730_34750 [Streptomyces sp. NBC_01298]
MSPGDWVWACIGTASGLIFLSSYGWDVWHKRHTDRRFQATAKQAARAPRDEDAVRTDLAKARAALDLTTCLAIWDITPHDIPHQTRRTEEDQ